MIIEVVRNLSSCRGTLKKGKPRLEWDLNPMHILQSFNHLVSRSLLSSWWLHSSECIDALQSFSIDTGNNAAMHNCWWTNSFSTSRKLPFCFIVYMMH